jgi:hypothetical protein
MPVKSYVAKTVPFEPNALLGFSSTDVQAAIEEAKSDAFYNDRYPFIGSYNGNANAGRYLEVFPGIGSDSAPFLFPENSQVVTVTLGNTTMSTGTIGFFKTTDLVNPVFSLSLTNQTTAIFTGLAHSFASQDQMAIRVTAGSLNKPYIRVWINTVT